MIKLIITVALLAAVGYFIVHVYLSYKASTGKFWPRLFAATKDSATLFWIGINAAVTATVNGFMNITDFLGAPEVREFVTANFSPEIASGVILVILFLLTLARMRTAK